MIKHVVAFKLKEPTQDNCCQTKNVLLSMNGKVPMIKALEVGVDFLHSNRSYDILLCVTLENEASLDEYQHDEYHVGVVQKHMHSVVQSSIAVDYVLD
jgi:hypothetical protein